MSSKATPSVQPKAPYRIGRYLVEAELDRGGVGAVYRVLDQATGRRVALKTLEQKDERIAALFEREYHTLASLRHPCIIEVYDFSIAQDGRRYYTMELLDGSDLADLAPLPWKKACEHLRDVATSLALLHARRLLHRDLSPRNVRLDSNGRAKLIDFGTLSPFGSAAELAGTPAFISPEAVRRLPLDQRADLFSLGATAYFALTGRKPFAIHELREAEYAFRFAPSSPSTHVPDIPAALDHLVLSLLSVDPLGRPSSAAEVIERLGAIAGLDDKPLTGIAKGHLLSSALIGREREKAQLTRHLERSLQGQGSSVILEGTAGMGRSRVASDLVIEARMAGLITLRVEALAHPEPGGIMSALTRALLDMAPEEAGETSSAYLPVLGQVFKGVNPPNTPRSRLSERTLPIDPAERRACVQNALVEWLLAVAERRPLLIVVDDVHSADADSAGALIVLAHAARNARVMLLVTHLLNAASPVAIQKLLRTEARIRLRGLSNDAVGQLVASTFGEVPNRARLSKWLYSVGHGNPARSLELLGHLVDRNIIRYAEGAWALPADISEGDLPASIEEALSVRLSELSPTALKLEQLLALHRGAISLSLASHLLPEIGRSQLYAALDELVSLGILVGSGDGYRFGQEALRTLLIESLGADEVRDLHLALGQALISLHVELFKGNTAATLRTADSSDLVLALQTGWHLLFGGDAARGRDLLRNAGIELTHRGDGLAEAVPALEAALNLYRKEGRSRWECAYLMIPLTLAGAYIDWHLSYRYSEELIEILADITGMSLARRLERWLGAHLALVVAIAISFVLFTLPPRRNTARTFLEAFLGLISLSSAIVGNYAFMLDRERARWVLEHLRPLRLFPRTYAIGAVDEFLNALVDTIFGRYSLSWTRGRRALALLTRPGAVTGVPEDARVQLEAGFHILTGSLDACRVDGSVHETLRALDRLHTLVPRQTAAGIRAAYHANRGEWMRSESFQREVDVLAVQAGSAWRQDVLIARNLWCTYALCEDVMGLKRTVRELERLASEISSLADTRDAASACYLAERGKHDEAIERYGAMFERKSEEPTAMATRFVGAYARILRAAGQARKARDLCQSALGRLPPEELEFVTATHGTRLELALAIADLGERAQAAEMLDSLLDDQKSHDNPLIHGLTHKARARVALLDRDRPVFERHLSAMRDWFSRTENPALVAQCQRLAEEGKKAGLIEDVRPYSYRPGPRLDRGITEVIAAFSECRGPAERLKMALDLVVDKTGAERGYLYVLEPDGLKFVAPAIGIEPPETVVLELNHRIELICNDELATSIMTDAELTEIDLPITPGGDTSLNLSSRGREQYHSLLLTIPNPDHVVAVGAVALLAGDEPIKRVDFEFLVEVARGIYQSGDIKTMYLSASIAPKHPGPNR